MASHIDWSRKVDVKYDCDVAVVGGGIAGVSAACSAAKSGAKVVLVERFAVTGGDCTTGGVAAFCGETVGQGEVFDEILRELAAFDAVEPYTSYPEADHRCFDHELLAVILQEMLLRRGVKLLLHTRFVDAIVSDGRITEVILCGKSGPEALRARQFIDCTGEAELARAAGAATVKGRDSDQAQLPMSLMFFVRHVEEADARRQSPPGRFDAIADKDDLPMTSIWPNGPRSNAIKVKIPMYDSTDTESMTAAEIAGRRRMMEVLDYYQRAEGRPWLLDHCSAQIGIREGCRAVGDYILTVDDLWAAREFPDAVARGTYRLDAHSPDDDKRTTMIPRDERDVPPYQIPLGSLVVKGISNLLAGGRCISADQLALSSARVTTSSSMTGAAAGIAAAMAADSGCKLREVDAAAVRGEVEARGAAI